MPSSHRITLFASLLAALTLLTPLHAADVRETQLEQQMWQLLNADRAANGLPALRFDARVAGVARQHSLEMATSGYFSHQSPTTGDPASRLARGGIAWSAYAENIAYNASVPAAQRSLMNSPGHRTNILNPAYDTVGIGIVRKGRSIMATQVFVRAGRGVASGRGGRQRRWRTPFGF